MSRIGKKIRTLPAGVTATIQGATLSVKGPRGELAMAIHPRVTVALENNALTVSVADENSKRDRALWGTFSSLIENMIDGVTKGFEKKLEINGVGFKATLKGKTLVLEVGLSHPVEVEPLSGITFSVEKNIITVAGNDKHQVGEQAAIVRRVRKPEPYKGKGIKYVDEVIRRKAGKAATKAAA